MVQNENVARHSQSSGEAGTGVTDSEIARHQVRMHTDGEPEFSVETRNAEFLPSQHAIQDRKATGAQIGHLAGAHPIEEFSVLAHLESGTLESLRPEEVVDLADPKIERFFVIRSSQSYRWAYTDLSMEWPLPRLTGEQVRFLCKVPDDEELVLQHQGVPDEEIGDDDEADLSATGLERLYSRTAKPHITIWVDAEPYEPKTRKMTPNEIIAKAAHKDPNENYLVRITKHGNVSYKDKGDVPIRLKYGMQFQVVSTGPTPVSDTTNKTGVAAFIESLVDQGFDPKQVPGHADHIYFDYTVPTGKFKGKEVRIGLAVPDNFPLLPPPGPNISPPIHPYGSTAVGHPLGNISDATGTPFGKVGGEWQYWSRPHQYWGKTKKNAAAYMSHIWQLWETQ